MTQRRAEPATPAGVVLPYFTAPDPHLTHDGGGRDPLGMQPVWSEIGRGLVPCLASPVAQVSGVRAVLLIHWIGALPALAALQHSDKRRRGFLRLMEGILEYWLYQQQDSRHQVCFGGRSLQADNFTVEASSTKTVANGLHLYYRGSCRRAGFFDKDWNLDEALGRQFASLWPEAATAVLAPAIASGLAGRKVHVRALFNDHPALPAALSCVFGDQGIHVRLRGLLGEEEKYHALARQFGALRRTDKSPLHQRVQKLESAPLAHALEQMHNCEPFLLVMQDVFNLLLASGNVPLAQLAQDVGAFLEPMRQRARNFLTLAGKLKTRRMRHMQELAQTLAAPGGIDAAGVAHAFIVHLLAYHEACMEERGKEPLVLVEVERIVVASGGDADAAAARKRLLSGVPWDHDYYLNTAATIHQQLYSGEKP